MTCEVRDEIIIHVQTPTTAPLKLSLGMVE